MSQANLSKILRVLTSTSPPSCRGKARRAALEKDWRRACLWANSKGVHGFGIGERITRGTRLPDTLCLRMYVQKKQPRAKLKNPAPSSIRLGDLTRVKIDVVEDGVPRLQSRARPGFGIGLQSGGLGTFGCLVRKGSKLYILGSSHVLAKGGAAASGESIIQVSSCNKTPLNGREIARLSDWTPLKFGPGYPNKLDAAIARVKASKVNAILCTLGVAPKGTRSSIKAGELVQKIGANTGHTTSSIDSVFSNQTLKFGNRWVGYKDLVRCTPAFTDEGDSGALILDEKKRAVGIHVGGSKKASYFCKIAPILKYFEVEVVGGH